MKFLLTVMAALLHVTALAGAIPATIIRRIMSMNAAAIAANLPVTELP